MLKSPNSEPFVQFKKREKHQSRSFTFSKVAADNAVLYLVQICDQL